MKEIKKCVFCGKLIFRIKSKIQKGHGNKRIAHTIWKKVRFCSRDCKIKGTKGELYSPKSIFKKGHIPHNKGKIKLEIRKNGGWMKFLRKNPEYYVSELRENAIRNHEKGYDKKRMEQIKERGKEIKELCGIFKPRKFTDGELEYLENNFIKKHIWEMALYLERSYSSVSHKLNRLGLIQNNRWINEK